MKGITPAGGFGGGDQPSFFNVRYGKASMSLTGTSSLIIATTQSAFHGMSIVTTSGEACTVMIYDSTGSASGNLLGLISLPGNTGTQWDLNTPTMSRNGIVAVKTGTSSKVTVFYGPKG